MKETRVMDYMVTAQFLTSEGVCKAYGFPLLRVHQLENVGDVFRSRLNMYRLPEEISIESFRQVLHWVPLVSEYIANA